MPTAFAYLVYASGRAMPPEDAPAQDDADRAERNRIAQYVAIYPRASFLSVPRSFRGLFR